MQMLRSTGRSFKTGNSAGTQNAMHKYLLHKFQKMQIGSNMCTQLKFLSDSIIHDTSSQKLMRSIYLLNRVEIWVIQIAQEPQNTWSQYFSKEKNEGGKIKYVDHTNEPVNEHRISRRKAKTVFTIFQSRFKHVLKKIEHIKECKKMHKYHKMKAIFPN